MWRPVGTVPHAQLRKVVCQLFSFLVRNDVAGFANVYVRGNPELLALFVRGYDS